MLRLLTRFVRLLASFAAAVWGMRTCLDWVRGGTHLGMIGGLLLLTAICLALGKIVDEEVRRDSLAREPGD